MTPTQAKPRRAPSSPPAPPDTSSGEPDTLPGGPTVAEAADARAQIGAALPASDSDEPLVDLDDIAPHRPTVRKGGVLYEMRQLDDFGISDQQRLTRDGREFFRLWSSDEELSKTERQRLELLLRRMFEQVLDAPAEIRQALSDGEKAQVVLGFVLAPLAQRTAQTETEDQAREQPPTTGS